MPCSASSSEGACREEYIWGLGASPRRKNSDAVWWGYTEKRFIQRLCRAPAMHRWERLELSCCISLQRLTDPAKGVGCSHRARHCSCAHTTHIDTTVQVTYPCMCICV